MLQNYLKMALRHLRKHPAYTFINVAGLAIGLACCALMLRYVQDERHFDAFHAKADRIYRLVEERSAPEGARRRFAQTVGPVGPALVEAFPEVTRATRLARLGRFTVGRGDTRFYEGNYLFGEPGFFDVFDFAMLRGDPATALSDPQSVVLTEAAVEKYFGREDPLGKTLPVEALGEMKVTGVLRDVPPNSHLTFSMLFSLATMQQNDGWNEFENDWTPNSRLFITYVVLGENTAPEMVAARLPAFLDGHRAEEDGVLQQLLLQPLRDVHFHSAGIELDRNAHKGDLATLYILCAVALFIVLIACINFMNLATARSASRAREIGLRKVVGAYRLQLIGQLLSESILLSFLALVAAVALVQLALPAFNALAGKELSLGLFTDGFILPALLALTLAIGVAAGSYPAFYLSKVRPAGVLKGTLTSGPRAARLRQGLVVTQFTLSIVMIVGTVVVRDQLDYVRSKRLGFDQEHLVVVDINSGSSRSAFATVKEEFMRSPAVSSVAVSSRVPGDWKSIAEVEAVPAGPGDDGVRTAHFIAIDENFLDTYGVTLAEGRNFSPTLAADTAAVLLNEAAVKAFGLTAPVGARLVFPDVQVQHADGSTAPFRAEVIGVVNDFNFRSLYEPIGPLVLGHRTNPVDLIDYFTVRVDGRDLPATLDFLRRVGERFDPDHPFEYNFLDAKLAEFYEADARIGTLFGFAAALAIVIACLGLFGLAAFTAERRTKELGVRKVLGATVPNLVLLLSREFVRLVLVAFVLATPLAYFVMQRWLEDFAYRTEIGPGLFALAGLMALAAALLTVSYQAVKAALANPVKVLRYE